MDKNKFLKNKKGAELALQTIVVFIILLIVLIFIIYFFVGHYSQGSSNLFEIGNKSINIAKNYN